MYGRIYVNSGEIPTEIGPRRCFRSVSARHPEGGDPWRYHGMHEKMQNYESKTPL